MKPDEPSSLSPSPEETDYELMKEFMSLSRREPDIRENRIQERASFHDSMKKVSLTTIEAQR